MKEKHPKTNRVAVSLYFDGGTFIAKLVRRVPGPNYKKAGDVIEQTFSDVFDSGYEHKSGSTQWSKKGADPDRADMVSARLSLHDEILSVTYKRPPTVIIPRPSSLEEARRKTKGHKAAIGVLKTAVSGSDTPFGCLDQSIQEIKDAIKRLEKQLHEAREHLDGLQHQREQILETIRALGG